MMMSYIGSWREYIGREYADNNEEETEKIFSHIKESYTIRSLGP